MLADVDAQIFGENARPTSAKEAARAMIPYLRRMAKEGVKPHHATRHMLGLFHGRPGARTWRRALSDNGTSAGPDAIERALAAIETAPVLPADPW